MNVGPGNLVLSCMLRKMELLINFPRSIQLVVCLYSKLFRIQPAVELLDPVQFALWDGSQLPFLRPHSYSRGGDTDNLFIYKHFFEGESPIFEESENPYRIMGWYVIISQSLPPLATPNKP